MMNWLTYNIPTCEGINVWLGNTYLADDVIKVDDDELLHKEVTFERTESLPCDPELCRSMGRTICVDCTKCVHHCVCEQQNDVSTCSTGSSISCESFVDHRGRRSVNHPLTCHPEKANVVADKVNKSYTRNVSHYGCDPAKCEDQRICGDCSRCSRHCTCIMDEERENERSRSLTSHMSSTRIRNSIRRRWTQTNRPLSASKMSRSTSDYVHRQRVHHRVGREERPSMVGNRRRR